MDKIQEETNVEQRKSPYQRIPRFYLSHTFLWLLVCIGIILHFSQYLFNRSLWVDEALVAMKIINSSYSEFFQSSETPLGFLIVEKFLVQFLGDSEYVLRLFPFISGIISIFLFLKVAPYFLKSSAVPIALGIFVISGRLIYHSSTLKQYSSDVLFTLFLYIVTLKILSTRPTIQRILGFGIIGALIIWFSHPIVFILAGVGGYLTVSQIMQKRWRKMFAFSIAYVFWGISFATFYFIGLRDSTTTEAGQQFWAAHFMPFPPSSFSDIIWFVRTFFNELIQYALEFPKSLFSILEVLRKSFFSMTGLSPSIGASLSQIAELFFSSFVWILVYCIAACMIIAGGVSMCSRSRGKFFLLVVPIFLTLLASGLHKYPFANRLIVFMLPHIFLFLGEGATWIREKTKPFTGVTFILALFMFPIFSAGSSLIYPRTHEEARPVIRYLKEHKQDGDLVYVYYASQVVFEYYMRRLDFHLEDYIQGISSRDDWRKYIQDLQQLHGHRRVWLFFSHAYSEEAFFLSYLDSIGKRLDSFKDERASVYLYDLR